MCGIVGFFGNKNSFLLNSMSNAIAHRGPDQNIKIENGKINIGFRRLSINDLKTGDQPFFNSEKKLTIVFKEEKKLCLNAFSKSSLFFLKLLLP